MLQEAGYVVDTYDKFFAPDSGVFGKPYDFITATEVVEHLRDPRFELERLYGLIKYNGLLGIMTKLVTNRSAFETWHYIRDATHICFFSRATFEWLGDLWKARVEFIGNDVIFIHKNS
jgi:2-polyprenyl-3-methyl-5-hydroxy-6-metoxy-1,4-benzoquinol methylase